MTNPEPGPATPEIRVDQLTGLPVILAAGRAQRPEAFLPPESPGFAAVDCPFCEGHEDLAPPEVYAVRPDGGEPNTPGWTVRVVPNLYPALSAGGDQPQGEEPQSGFTSAADPLLSSSRMREPDLFSSRPALGAHEVIVHTPEHVATMVELSDERFAGAIEVWRARMRAHSDAAYVQLIVNEGRSAGASREHSHSQLYALPFVPATVARERERVGAYRERTAGGSLLTDILSEEVRRSERLVAIDDDAVLVCPWASSSPFELRVIPRRESARFEEDDAGVEMLRTGLRALAARFGRSPDLNIWVRTAPQGSEHFHWHIDIAPRLTIYAGFELSTGVRINIYPPERAAADLREVLGS
jgi:UDPglucose--hexose-1-phosphate uridylyltransferase